MGCCTIAQEISRGVWIGICDDLFVVIPRRSDKIKRNKHFLKIPLVTKVIGDDSLSAKTLNLPYSDDLVRAVN